jgi:hypothetical protein
MGGGMNLMGIGPYDNHSFGPPLAGSIRSEGKFASEFFAFFSPPFPFD